MSNANDLLMSGGVPAAKFPTVGSTVSGRIVREPEARDQTDFTTGAVLRWDNGEPKKQIVVQVATAERDPQNPSDDGVRTIYIKGNMINAVRQAVRSVNAPGLEVGGTLTITYAADGNPSRAGLNAPKLYSAQYQPPTAAAANAVLAAGETQTNVPQPQSTFPAPAPAQQAPAGVDPALWAQLSAEQRASVLAASTGVR